jgi:hypothetical protein
VAAIAEFPGRLLRHNGGLAAAVRHRQEGQHLSRRR